MNDDPAAEAALAQLRRAIDRTERAYLRLSMRRDATTRRQATTLLAQIEAGLWAINAVEAQS